MKLEDFNEKDNKIIAEMYDIKTDGEGNIVEVNIKESLLLLDKSLAELKKEGIIDKDIENFMDKVLSNNIPLIPNIRGLADLYLEDD